MENIAYKNARNLNELLMKIKFCLSFCLDINECTDETHNCHTDGYCNNTDGSFHCTCHIGYRGNGENCSGENLYDLKQ